MIRIAFEWNVDQVLKRIQIEILQNTFPGVSWPSDPVIW